MTATWNIVSINGLLDIWAEERVQDMLESSYRNADVYKDIAAKLNEGMEGPDFTWEQCRNKVKALRVEYRKAKQYHDLSGSGRTRFIYFDKMDAVLGNRPSTTPVHRIDTSSMSRDITVLNSSDEEEQNQSVDGVTENGDNEEATSTLGEQDKAIGEDNQKVQNKTPDEKDEKNTHEQADQEEHEKSDAKETDTGLPVITRPKKAGLKSKPLEQKAPNNSPQNQAVASTSKVKSPTVGGFQIRKKKKTGNTSAGIAETLESFIRMEDRASQEQRQMEERLHKQQLEYDERLRKFELEREEMRRREDRSFQLQMMQMQMQMFQGVCQQPNIPSMPMLNQTNLPQTAPTFYNNDQRTYYQQNLATMYPPVPDQTQSMGSLLRSAIDDTDF